MNTWPESQTLKVVVPKVALSIRQPWAWLIVHGPKRIENRNWFASYRGELYIHAAKGMTQQEYGDCQDFVENIDPKLAFNMPHFGSLERGGIIGKCRMVGCVKESADPWFVGTWGFIFEDVEALPFRPLRGQLGFFQIEV